MSAKSSFSFLAVECVVHEYGEKHYSDRQGWLRAAVLGANDGIVSTASLIVGMAAAGSSQQNVVLAGVAGLVAGAMSMAAGEYVSVSAQADIERADLAREEYELAKYPEMELRELAEIYEGRGLDAQLARKVAIQLTEHDALGAHARDELGLSEIHSARPIQAAVSSAAAFSCGAALPLLAASVTPLPWVIEVVVSVTVLALIITGGLSASAGGARKRRAAMRVTVWGVMAMLLTALAGGLFGSFG